VAITDADLKQAIALAADPGAKNCGVKHVNHRSKSSIARHAGDAAYLDRSAETDSVPDLRVSSP
jgi:hypothetical protein